MVTCGRRVDAAQRNAQVAPVPDPEAVQPDVLLVRPARRSRIVADELAVGRGDVARLTISVRVEHGRDVHVARVRVAGQRHGLVLEEHLQARVGLVAAWRVDALQIGDAEGLEVGLPDLASCRFVEPLQHGGIGDRFPAGHVPSADESHGFPRSGPVDDRSVLGSAVLSGQFQWVRQFVGAAAQLDGDTARRQRSAGFERADRIPRPFECGKGTVGGRGVRLGESARPLVVTRG